MANGPSGSGTDAVAAFVEVMRRLRAECPWKQEQTHRSLARYLLEETHETLEAIDTGDAEHLREELGDLLLQVVFHAVIAEQAGEFDLDDIAADITAKMVRRNPHVFGSRALRDGRGAASSGTNARGRAPRAPEGGTDAESVTEVWEQIKAQEKQRTSPVEGLPPTLPALLYADKVLDRLAREGRPVAVDPSSVDPSSGDLGDRLLALVAEARAAGTDPEQALRDAVRRLL